jgi:putative flippase GtrA
MSERSVLLSRVVRYGIAGLVATAIYFGSVMLLVERAAVAPVPAAIIATIVVIVTSYVVNRAFVFDTDRPHASAFGRFVAASLLGIGLNAGLMHLATNVLSWPYAVGAALSTAVVPPLNFLVNHLWAFRPSDRP